MKKLIVVTLAALLCVSDLSADDACVADFTKMRMKYAKGEDFDPGWKRH